MFLLWVKKSIKSTKKDTSITGMNRAVCRFTDLLVPFSAFAFSIVVSLNLTSDWWWTPPYCPLCCHTNLATRVKNPGFTGAFSLFSSPSSSSMSWIIPGWTSPGVPISFTVLTVSCWVSSKPAGAFCGRR